MKLKNVKKALFLGAATFAGTYLYKKYEELKIFYNEVVIGNCKTLYYSSELEDDSVAAVASAVKLNFIGVTPEEPSIYLNLFALGSSVTILVPDECRVVLDGTNSLSNIVVDELLEEVEKEFTLYIDYKAKASSVRIIYESALKEEAVCCSEGSCCDENCCDSVE